MTLEQTPRPVPPAARQTMTPGEYHFQCLRRSPAFREDILEFHRKYPRVWVALDGVTLKIPWREVTPQVRSLPDGRRQRLRAQGRLQLPVRGREDDAHDRVLIGTPQPIEDLRVLNGFAAELVRRRWYRRLEPEHGDEYFTALGSGSQQEWDADLKALAGRWPGVSPRWLRWPWVLDSAEQARWPWALRPRPHLLSPGQALPADAIAFIPFRLDTTEEEHAASWKAATKFRRQILPRKRQHGRAFRFRLEVFDHFVHLGSVTRVAVRLRKSKSTVSSALQAVLKDIPGAITETLDPHRHVEECMQCGKGKPCKEMQAWLDQVAPMQGGPDSPVGREPLPPLKSGRKLPHRTM